MPRLNWLPAASHPALPGALRAWLTDQDSLTARIKARCRRFQVKVLHEGIALPYQSERRLLGLRGGEVAWVREVLLLADGVPVVFAHSAAARNDLCGPWRLAAGGGTRPLGHALFADPAIARGPLHVAHIAGRVAAGDKLHAGAQRALAQELPAMWARRSCFYHQRRPLLVTEMFLPGILRLRDVAAK